MEGNGGLQSFEAEDANAENAQQEASAKSATNRSTEPHSGEAEKQLL